MSRWKVGDVMTTDVVSVGEEAWFRELVELLDGRRISGVPVVDAAGQVLGVVSEADLLPKMEYAGTPVGLHPFEGRRRRVARHKAVGDRARDLMSAPAVTVQAGSSLVEAVRAMDQGGVKRLPVVDESGRLVGIVTRGDLLRVFLRSDQEISADVRAELGQIPGVGPEKVTVAVAGGVVTLTGELPRLSLVAVVIQVAERVDGVIEVVNRLAFRYDDLEPAAITFA